MKVCIVFQGHYVKLGHAIALELKEKYGVQEFCGYAFSGFASDFLRQQKDIHYSSILADHELHQEFKKERLDLAYLRQLEKKYGIPNLLPYLYVDRQLMNSVPPKEYNGKFFDLLHPYPDLLRILQSRFRAIVSMLEKEKPDCIIFWTMGSTAQLILYYVAKSMGVPVLNVDLARTAHLVSVSRDYNTLTEVNAVFADVLAKKMPRPHDAEARDFVKRYRETGNLQLGFVNTTSPKDRITFLRPKNIFNSIRYLGRLTYDYFSKPQYYEPSYASTDPYHYLAHKLALKWRTLRGVKDLYSELPDGEEFAFFPLHCEPEVSMSLIAPFYNDQLHLVRQIARSLPIHMTLYVKEHPAMLHYRKRSYYKELLAIPNVKLLNPYLRSPEVVKKSRLNFAITGTVGWESILHQKPVITFGHIFYNSLSFVKQCHDIEQLPYIIQDQLNNFHHDEEELLDFVGSIFARSADMDFFGLWHEEVPTIRADKGFHDFMNLLGAQVAHQV